MKEINVQTSSWSPDNEIILRSVNSRNEITQLHGSTADGRRPSVPARTVGAAEIAYNRDPRPGALAGPEAWHWCRARSGRTQDSRPFYADVT